MENPTQELQGRHGKRRTMNDAEYCVRDISLDVSSCMEAPWPGMREEECCFGSNVGGS